MHYPSLAEYSDALQLSLGIALSDPLLARGTLRSRGPGQPVIRSGNFALTFEVEADGRSYAVRCFHKPSDSLQARYAAIGSHLRPHPQHLLRRLRIPAVRDHDRKRHLPHRADGLGARPDVGGIRGRAPGRHRCAAAVAHVAAGNFARTAQARHRARRHPADQRDRPGRDATTADRLRRHVRTATRGPAEHGTRPAQFPALRSACPAFRRPPRFVCVLAPRSDAARALPSTRTLGRIRQRCGRVHPARHGYRRSGPFTRVQPAGRGAGARATGAQLRRYLRCSFRRGPDVRRLPRGPQHPDSRGGVYRRCGPAPASRVHSGVRRRRRNELRAVLQPRGRSRGDDRQDHASLDGLFVANRHALPARRVRRSGTRHGLPEDMAGGRRQRQGRARRLLGRAMGPRHRPGRTGPQHREWRLAP